MTGEQPAPRSRAVSQSAEVRFHPVPGFMGCRRPVPGVRAARLRGRDSLRLRHASLPGGIAPGTRRDPRAVAAAARWTSSAGMASTIHPSSCAPSMGNVACHPGDPDASFPLIEAGIGAILDAGAIPISMGGDGAVTLPQLRVARRHPDFAVLHFDSHTDTYPIRATTPPPPSPRRGGGPAGCGAQFPCWHARQLLHARRAGVRPRGRLHDRALR